MEYDIRTAAAVTSACNAPCYRSASLLSVLCHLVLARFFAAFWTWQVFRLVPTPAILPMSLSRLTVDIDAVEMLYRTHGNGIARDSHPVPFSTTCEAVTKSDAKLLQMFERDKLLNYLLQRKKVLVFISYYKVMTI